MSSFKKLGVLVAILALSAIGAATASAASFTYSATGSLSGKATTTQTLTTNSGQLKCTVASTTGSIVSTSLSEIHVTVQYSGCTAFGFASVDISPAKYTFTANGTADLKSSITFNVTLAGCHMTITPGSHELVSYTNSSGKLLLFLKLSRLRYHGTGGLCGSSTEQTNGTYEGKIEIERVGGGSISWDA